MPKQPTDASPEGSLTRFLNVDLDVRVRNGLGELLKYFDPSVVVLHQTDDFASVELSNDYTSAEETILKIIEMVENLPPLGKSIWSQCDLRAINIGIQAGGESHSAHFALSKKTTAHLAQLQFEILFTVYGRRAAS